MIQFIDPLAHATAIEDSGVAQRPGREFRTPRKPYKIAATQQARQTTVVPNPLAVPSFLLHRMGWTWTRIRADLRLIVSSDAEDRQIRHGLPAFVGTDVVGTAEQPRHGSGILMGLPLTSGWRRRLFVCPDSEQLLWIDGEYLRCGPKMNSIHEPPDASSLLIASFNPEPQATAFTETVACGSGFSKTANFAG